MKKKVSILLFFLIIIQGFVYSKTLFSKRGSITCPYTSDNNYPNYSLEISSNNDDDILIVGNNVFLKEGSEFTIKYSGAEVGGSAGSATGHGEGICKTVLYVNSSSITGFPRTYTETIHANNNTNYRIRLVEESQIDSRSSSSVLFSKDFITVNEIYGPAGNRGIPNYSGSLCNCSGTLEPGSFVYRYSLNVSCTNTYITESNNNGTWPVWYAKKGQEIDISYTGAHKTYDYSGYNEEAQTGGSIHAEDYTDLVITVDGKRTNVTPTQVNGNLEIELWKVHEDNSNNNSRTLETKVIILADSKVPTMPTLSGASGGWTKDNCTITAGGSTDEVTGLYCYKYSLDNGATWQRGNGYTTLVQQGGCLNTKLLFKAVDLVGNESSYAEAQIKIDKASPVFEVKAGNQIAPVREWLNGTITLSSASDTGSGLSVIELDSPGNIVSVPYVMTDTGVHTITAKDIVGNYTSKTYWIDNSAPVINGIESQKTYRWDWTNKNVAVDVSDIHSGIKSVKINETEKSTPYTFSFDKTGRYIISSTDNAGNTNSKTVLIDKTPPATAWSSITPFTSFEYDETEGKKLLKSFTVNYTITEEESGIKKNGNILKVNNTVINESSEKNISFKDAQSIKIIDRHEISELTYSVDVSDKAGNSGNQNSIRLTVPAAVNLQIVSLENETDDIKRSQIKGEFTTIGLLMNKIDFSLYKNEQITIKRTFLGDMDDVVSQRSIIGYEQYKELYDETVDENYVRQKWNESQACKIYEADVKEIEIDGEQYWYYEDKIKTDSGLGHKGVRYQAEWEWKELPVSECGAYAEIDKTANSSGKLQIRLEGTDKNGIGCRYIVLDSYGNKIEDESDPDFYVPVDGVVKLSFRIEDDDADIYNVQTVEIIKADFEGNETGISEEHEIIVPKEGINSDGFIQKTNKNGRIISLYRTSDVNAEGWYKPDSSELKLYYNKPVNLKISMTEGCSGSNGLYKDVTESGLIMLKAVNPDIGGFSLLVGNDAGYNKDGISAQPHQKITLGLESKDSTSLLSDIEWDFGDGTESSGSSVNHIYLQSPQRSGNISEYRMSISFIQGQVTKHAYINIHIVDTQIGKLLGNEEWIGKHSVLGKLQIPTGCELKIKENTNNPDNETIIICAGSPVSDRKGFVEVLSGGRLEVQSMDKIIPFTEGKNGEEFSEIKTEQTEGNDESFGWNGIRVHETAEGIINNVMIKYAMTGLDVAGKVLADVIKINASDTGIKCGGVIQSGSVELNDIKELGIAVDGKMQIDNNILVTGMGESGITIKNNAELNVGNDIGLKGFVNGINNLGIITVDGNISISESKNYGIRNEGSFTTGCLKIQDNPIRGCVAGSGSSTNINNTYINASDIGIHIIGTAVADFGKTEVTGISYGIKTDKDEKGHPTLRIKSGSVINADCVTWYDWSEGVLTVSEIENKMYSE